MSDEGLDVVGDLGPDRIVIRYTNGKVVHLPDEDCRARSSHRRTPDEKRAAVLFEDTPICEECLDPDNDTKTTGEATLPSQTEVQTI
jgi:hypothetical protein